MTEKRIGKIKNIKFGFGGYQDAQLGISVTLGSDQECWGVSDFRGHWGTERDRHCKWTESDRLASLGEMCMWARKLLADANKASLNDLIGIPVEVSFDGNILKEWRILTEVI